MIASHLVVRQEKLGQEETAESPTKYTAD